MERYRLNDIEIIFDRAGRDDWGKFSFPVWYGIPVKVGWRGYEFDFNLEGRLKKIAGKPSVWPDPREILKRTEGNDFIYYGADGYDSSYDLIKNYYFPSNGRSNCGLFTENPLVERHVQQALEIFDRLVREADKLAPAAAGDRVRTFLRKIALKDRAALAREGKELHRIIGGRLPVLPPDTIDVDYEVIPLVVADGCSYHCNFCTFKTSGVFRVRSRRNIASQLQALRSFYAKDLVNYNSLVLGQNNALAAGEEILIAAARMAYDILNLAESFHRGRPNLYLFGSVDSFLDASHSLFDRLEGLPYRTCINLGLESPDQPTLNRLGKPLRADKVRAAFWKMQEINNSYSHIMVSGNFVLGQALPPQHIEAIKELLAAGRTVGGKGVIYLSPLFGGSQRRQILKEFREIKMTSSLPVFIYLAQRL